MGDVWEKGWGLDFAYADPAASKHSDLDVYLKGINKDSSRRLSGDDLVQLGNNMAGILNEDEWCILSSVLGGALENTQVQGTSWMDALTYWTGGQNEINSAQATCRTDITFSDVWDKVFKKSPKLAEWLQNNRNHVTTKIEAQYDYQRQETANRVVQAEANAVKNAADAVSDTASGIFKWTPRVLAAVVVVALGVGAVVLYQRAKKG